ncbi:hypothetical protein N39L_55530 [Limnospira platensis NIES-39]|uniref:Transposase n=1 Tax=Limnospira platensis NIES-46 TaxID=1236695 RepID=A0A5M3TEY7_LIMPL|nr:hypothetical protein NIES39_D03350 [Arthrospira platensis NIES-39]GCE96526.1 hypothetical protein NIES46_45980 [Arthrospira platensis NIES-46]BAI89906.1 hypothetical protein NIES39_D04880 [Arthrospira platensis NIES-39]BAI90299.1 hypothetical protein NIES39_E00650 [Arthrospira platensis NIES-39]BAI90909.1 hypothetical protein NIES39_G01270 [Arthrospira platensis NIES-39]
MGVSIYFLANGLLQRTVKNLYECLPYHVQIIPRTTLPLTDSFTYNLRLRFWLRVFIRGTGF